MKRFLFCGAVALVPLCGCRMVAQKAAQSIVEKMGGAPFSLRSGANVDVAYVNSLAPLPSGPGLIVCAPIADAALKNQAAWGAGAARWLQVQVAGRPELGKTPLWSSTENARLRLKYPDLALDGARAEVLGQSCGVTHVATATLKGTPAAAILNYQLRDVKAGKVVASAKISGAMSQLTAQLPQLASALEAQFRLKAPTAKIALAADDVKFLGTPNLNATYRPEKLNVADEKRLENLAAKDPMAAIMAQSWCKYRDQKSWQKVADSMLSAAPNNALVWGEAALRGPQRLASYGTKLAAMQRKYPNNYLLAQAGVALERDNGARPLQISWAEKAVRAAPGNSYAWNDLADALFDGSQALRRSRYARDISAAQWKQLNAFYARYQAAAQKATQIEPRDTYAWSTLAQAATFNGDDAIAQSALKKSLALDARNHFAWEWAMQMMQPKWSGNDAQFIAFATRAAPHAADFYFPAEDVAHVFGEAGQRVAFKPILQTVVAKDPNNVEALTELGAIYHYDDRSYRKAEKLYRAALKIAPNHTRALTMLGDLTYWVHNDPKGAEALYKSAVASNPRDGYAHANLGRMYALTGRQSQGVTEANLAKKCGFDDRSHPVWQATGVSPPLF